MVDSGPLVAVGSTSDSHHDACAKAFADHNRETLLVSPLVVAEVCQLLEKRVGPEVEATFLASLVNSPFKVAALNEDALACMAELVIQYSGFPLGAADASVIALAEQNDVDTVMTIDHRHFRAVRPLHVPYFNLIP